MFLLGVSHVLLMFSDAVLYF